MMGNMAAGRHGAGGVAESSHHDGEHGSSHGAGAVAEILPLETQPGGRELTGNGMGFWKDHLQ